MQNKFQNKYRIPSARLQNWDYSNNGAYFITICTKNRRHFFGKIHNGVMQLTEAGKIAYQLWEEIPDHFPFIELGNFVIMPNHVHGILIINQSAVEMRFIASPNPTDIASKNSTENSTENSNKKETQLVGANQVGGFSGDKNPMLHDNISRVIRWFKGRCSFEIKKNKPDFGWQSRFHDHVIRNSQSFDNIQNYIEQNPLKWENDTFYNELNH